MKLYDVYVCVCVDLGPYRDTDTKYTLEAHVSVNEALEGDQGQYNGELTMTKGESLNFQVKKMKVKYFDTVYYSVTVQGTQGRTTWSQTLSGYKQVPGEIKPTTLNPF